MNDSEPSRSEIWRIILIRALLALVTFSVGYLWLGKGRTSALGGGDRSPAAAPASAGDSAAQTLAGGSGEKPALGEVLSAAPGEFGQTLARFIKESSPEDLEALAQAWNFERLAQPDYVWEMVLARWAVIDGAGAFAAAKKVGLESTVLRLLTEYDAALAVELARENPQKYLSQIGYQLAKSDLGLAMTLAEDFPEMLSYSEELIRAMVRADPHKAMALVLRIGNKSSRDLPLRYLFDEWAAADSGSALTFMRSEPSSAHTNRMAHSIFRALLETDPDQAQDFVSTMKDGSTRHGLSLELVRKLAEQDPQKAFAWAGALTNPNTRRAALTSIATKTAKGDPLKLIAFVEEYGWDMLLPNPVDSRSTILGPGGGSRGSSGGGFSYWVGQSLAELVPTDPERAIRMAAKLNLLSSGSGLGGGAFEKVASAWFNQDPAAMLNWIQSEQEHLPYTSVWHQLVREGSEEERQQLAQVALASKSESLGGGIALAIAQEPHGFSNQELLQLSNSLDPDTREEFFEGTLTNLLQKDRERAFELLPEIPSGRARRDFIGGAISQIASNDGIEPAREWFGKLPETDRDAGAHRAMTEIWLHHDSIAASAWISEMAPGANRDAGAQTISSFMARSDRGASFEWAESIGDETSRQNALSRVYDQWIRDEPEAGMAALSESALPDNLKSQLQQRHKK